MFAVPTRQIYWGIYARINPMLDENDLIKLGKDLIVDKGTSLYNNESPGHAYYVPPTGQLLLQLNLKERNRKKFPHPRKSTPLNQRL